MTHNVEHMQRATFADGKDGAAQVTAIVDADGNGEKVQLLVSGETVVLSGVESVQVLLNVATAARDYMKSHADARRLKAAASKAK